MADVATCREVLSGLGRLTEFTAGIAFGDIPATVRERAGLILCDDFAAMVAAREEPGLRAMQRTLTRRSGPPEATLFDGGKTRLDRLSAALANGAAADWCELDGGYRAAICHAGLYCLPALLAEAEAEGTATVADVLLALVAGYETVARIARCFAFSRPVLHPHGALAAVGAAAAVAKLRGLDAAATARAIGSASTMTTPGPFNHAVAGALIRNVWPGLGAQAGINAVDWAGFGIAGRPESLLDVYADVYGAAVHPAALTEGLGARFAVEDGFHKLHACCQFGHSAVEAALAAREALGPDFHAARIASITVETHEKGLVLDNAAPETTLAAKFSMQHMVAATLHFGHAGAAAFHAGTLHDPAIAALRERIILARLLPELPPPEDRPARVTVTLSDGRTEIVETLSARGGPDRPFMPQEITAKIAGILAAPYPAAMAHLAPILALEGEALRTPFAQTIAAIVAPAP